MAADARLPLISATGSCAMGRAVGAAVAQRLGRSLLELGGNNGLILTESADLDLALRAVAVRRRRHRGPALHDAAAADRSRIDRRYVRPATGRRPTRASSPATRGKTACCSAR